MENIDRILNAKQVAEITGLPSTTMYRLIAAGSFPRPVQLGPRRVGWKSSSIQAWIDALVQTQ